MQKPGVQLINNGCRIRAERHYWGGQAEKNSILRAISGGPIYVSNQIGRSRRDLLMPLVLEDGHILRCDRPGMPTAECIFENPINSGKIFKIQNGIVEIKTEDVARVLENIYR